MRERIEVVRAESVRLGDYVSGLSADQLARPSACDRWRVDDTVGHLAFVAQFQGRMISRGLAGEFTPPEGASRPDPEALPASERIAQGAIQQRERLGDQLVATLRSRYSEFIQLLQGVDLADYAKPCWHPGGMTTVSGFVNMAVHEVALHGWDIQSSLDPDYHLSPSVLPVALDMAPAWAQRTFQPGPRLDTAMRYRFRLVDGPSQDFVIQGDTLVVETPGAQPADVTFDCDTETFALMIFGRLPIDKAVHSGRITCSGPHDAVANFGRYFGTI